MKLGEACTIVLRGATQQILDEAERSLHDALCVLSQTVKETKTVFGGGNVKTEILYKELVSFFLPLKNFFFMKINKLIIFSLLILTFRTMFSRYSS